MVKISSSVFLLILFSLYVHSQNKSWTYFPNTEYSDFVVADSDAVWLASTGLVKMLKDDHSLTYYNTSNSGIYSNTIYSLSIDDNQNLWMLFVDYASRMMQKFDGVNWTTYNNFPFELNTGSIESFLVDSNNHPWIRSNGSLYQFDGSNWNQVLVNGYGMPFITSLSAASDGSIYVAGYDGFNNVQQQFILTYTDTGWLAIATISDATLNSETIHSICKDHSGIIYAATNNGVYSYKGNTIKNLRYPSDFNNINKIVCGINEDREFTVVTYGEAVLFNLHTFTKLSSTDPRFAGHYESDAFIESAGLEWFASDSLIYGSGLSWSIVPTYSSYGQLGHTLYIDSAHQFVFLTFDNLYRKEENTFVPLIPFPSKPGDLSLAAYDSKENTWYAMDNTEKFYSFHGGDPDFSTFNSKPNFNGFNYSDISEIYIDRKSQLMETINYGTYGVVLKGESFRGLFLNSGNAWVTIMADGVYEFVVDSSNAYWILSETGLFQYSNDALAQIDLLSLNLASTDLRYLSIDNFNTIWLNTVKGLYNNATGVFLKYEVNDASLLQYLFFDQKNYAYSGSSAGLQIMKSGIITQVDRSSSNIPSDWIYNPVVDKYNNIWVMADGSPAVCYNCFSDVSTTFISTFPASKPQYTDTVTFFPNPVSDQFTFQIETRNQFDLSITITDLSGHTNLQFSDKDQPGSTAFSFPVAAMSNGIYFYTVAIDEKKFNGKFIVAR